MINLPQIWKKSYDCHKYFFFKSAMGCFSQNQFYRYLSNFSETWRLTQFIGFEFSDGSSKKLPRT